MTPLSASVEAPIYLDFAASTPPADEVVEAMLPWLRHAHANPHADHWHGHRANQALEEAREAVAMLIGSAPETIVFTSGATEANNLALKGMLTPQGACSRLWLTDIEHKSLREPAQFLRGRGIEVERIAVSSTGTLSPTALAEALSRHGRANGLVAVTHGNNEIGTLQPVAALSEVVHAYGHWLHVDASQSAGRIPLDVETLGCQLLCVSSHKLYGPGGIGALYVDPELRERLQPQMHGGGQEGGLRSGTVAPFLAVGFGTAARLARRRLAEDAAHLWRLTGAFIGVLNAHGVRYNWVGEPEQRLPGHVSLRFPGLDAEDMLAVLAPALSASTGSACAAGELRASSALRALGLDERMAGEVIRFTFGRSTPRDAVQCAAVQVVAATVRVAKRSS